MYKRTESSGRVQSGENKWSSAPWGLAERWREGMRVGLLPRVYQERVDGVLSSGEHSSELPSFRVKNKMQILFPVLS